jgi:hypothetical protein
MNNAVASQPYRTISGAGRQTAQIFLQPAGSLLLHPIIVLPAFVYLLGGSAAQIAWYAVVAGLAYGIAGPTGSLVTSFPQLTRLIAGVLLTVQMLGFLIIAFAALRAGGISDDGLLGIAATGFLILLLPTGILLRIVEQSREYARASVSPMAITIMAGASVVLTGFGIWRLTDSPGAGVAELLGRLLLAGALALTAAAWLGLLPMLTSDHLPYPARTLPSTNAPGFFTNSPLMRYTIFQLFDGISRFADPFILIGVISLFAPDLVWWGGAALAFAIGEALARFIMSSTRQPNARTAIVFGTFLRAMTLILIAFVPTLATTTFMTERNLPENWQNWIIVVAALLLGTGYWLSHAGNARYIQSITPPSTRELTRAVIGVVLIVTAFAPIIAIRMQDSMSFEVLLRYGAGAAVIVLLTTAMIIRPYSPPGRRGGSWTLRRQSV